MSRLTTEQLLEFTRSATATRLGISNVPGPAEIANLERVRTALDRVERLVDRPIQVLSGYRCLRLNAAVGGAPQSYHMAGCAVDFDPPEGWTHDELQHAIAEDLELFFDLCLEERARDGAHWLHLQVPRPGAVGRRLLRDAELGKQGGAITRITAG
jgi:zinc D-Ala-D-Ala carboxypeptidase